MKMFKKIIVFGIFVLLITLLLVFFLKNRNIESFIQFECVDGTDTSDCTRVTTKVALGAQCEPWWFQCFQCDGDGVFNVFKYNDTPATEHVIEHVSVTRAAGSHIYAIFHDSVDDTIIVKDATFDNGIASIVNGGDIIQIVVIELKKYTLKHDGNVYYDGSPVDTIVNKIVQIAPFGEKLLMLTDGNRLYTFSTSSTSSTSTYEEISQTPEPESGESGESGDSPISLYNDSDPIVSIQGSQNSFVFMYLTMRGKLRKYLLDGDQATIYHADNNVVQFSVWQGNSQVDIPFCFVTTDGKLYYSSYESDGSLSIIDADIGNITVIHAIVTVTANINIFFIDEFKKLYKLTEDDYIDTDVHSVIASTNDNVIYYVKNGTINCKHLNTNVESSSDVNYHKPYMNTATKTLTCVSCGRNAVFSDVDEGNYECICKNDVVDEAYAIYTTIENSLTFDQTDTQYFTGEDICVNNYNVCRSQDVITRCLPGEYYTKALFNYTVEGADVEGETAHSESSQKDKNCGYCSECTVALPSQYIVGGCGMVDYDGVNGNHATPFTIQTLTAPDTLEEDTGIGPLPQDTIFRYFSQPGDDAHYISPHSLGDQGRLPSLSQDGEPGYDNRDFCECSICEDDTDLTRGCYKGTNNTEGADTVCTTCETTTYSCNMTDETGTMDDLLVCPMVPDGGEDTTIYHGCSAILNWFENLKPEHCIPCVGPADCDLFEQESSCDLF